MEKTTTADAMRRLIESYSHSQYYYAARQKVDEISQIVRPTLKNQSSSTFVNQHPFELLHYLAERHSLGFRGKSGQLPDANLHFDQALVHQHVKRFWVLLVEAADLYSGHHLHWNHLLECWNWIHCYSGSATDLRSLFLNALASRIKIITWNSQARGSCASFVFGFVTFMSIGGFPSFVEDMKVQRERFNISGLTLFCD